MTANKKVKLSEGEALKNKDAKGSDKKIQVWIPKSTIAYEEEKLKLHEMFVEYIGRTFLSQCSLFSLSYVLCLRCRKICELHFRLTLTIF